MTTEELIEELKKQPPLYKVLLYQPKIELPDEFFEAGPVECISLTKNVAITIGEKL